MDLIASWVVYPAVLVAICAGNGLLTEYMTFRAPPRATPSGGGRVRRRTLPTALLPAVGLASVIVVAQVLTLTDATAELATPAVVALAVLGLVLGARRRFPIAPWAIAAAAGVFAVYAAPVVLSGEATVAGFIKLDDTATWLALTDRALEHGRDLDGLAPSTYEATLAVNLGDGYPIGVFLPFGIASQLIGVDVAWTIQPYMACLGVFLALGLWTLARPLAARPPLRAAAAFVGAIPALLYGYYLWGGVKELAAAALIATLAALLVRLRASPSSVPALVPPAIVGAALVGVLSGGAAVWLLPLLIPVAGLLWSRIGRAAALARAAGFGLAVAVLSLPVFLSGGLLPPTSSSLSEGSARGNLAGPLEPAQAAGIWLVGDFRFAPDAELVTYVLIAIACVAAAAAILWCLRRGELGVPLYVLGALAGCAVLVVLGSPWVEGKALATASAAIPFAAMLAVGALVLAGRRIGAMILALAVAGGVLWSVALGYRDASLAPRAQLDELREIGERVTGEGPTLITEYSPYAARHFLRDGDPESISELRRRPVHLRDGSQVPKGQAADTDEIDPAALAPYNALVVRRGPAQSRPPSEFALAWEGEFYELWRRHAGARPATARLPLGGGAEPLAVPECERVGALAARAGPSGRLLAAGREPPLLVGLSAAAIPDEWSERGDEGAPVPTTPGELVATVEVARPARYELWLGGSIKPTVETRIDGARVGERSHELNNDGGYVSFGEVALEAGTHRVELEFAGAGLDAGSSGDAGPIGPLVLDPAGLGRTSLISVDPAEARARLCGREWDWIEAFAAPTDGAAPGG